MTSLNKDSKYMKMALALAEKGRGKTGPNPLVGAVVVKNGRLVGQGYHRGPGTAHAEALALQRAGRAAQEAALYINLEPCAHQGLTPPCAPRVAASGVKRVVVAMADPDKRVNGRGLALLRKRGIKVSLGALAGAAREQNRVYLKSKLSGLPYVTLKWAMGLDGKIATTAGDSKWISSPRSRRLVKRMRAAVDGVLVGRRTAALDDPGLRPSKGRGAAIVIDPALKLGRGLKLMRGGRTIVLTRAKGRKRALLEEARVEVVNLPLRRALAELVRLGVCSLLVEGGGETNAAFLEAGLVDELAVFIAPKLIGGREAVTPFEGRGVKRVAEALQLKKWSVEAVGGDLLVRGRM